jgi:hypothetical protein
VTTLSPAFFLDTSQIVVVGDAPLVGRRRPCIDGVLISRWKKKLQLLQGIRRTRGRYTRPCWLGWSRLLHLWCRAQKKKKHEMAMKDKPLRCTEKKAFVKLNFGVGMRQWDYCWLDRLYIIVVMLKMHASGPVHVRLRPLGICWASTYVSSQALLRWKGQGLFLERVYLSLWDGCSLTYLVILVDFHGGWIPWCFSSFDDDTP